MFELHRERYNLDVCYLNFANSVNSQILLMKIIYAQRSMNTLLINMNNLLAILKQFWRDRTNQLASINVNKNNAGQTAFHILWKALAIVPVNHAGRKKVDTSKFYLSKVRFPIYKNYTISIVITPLTFFCIQNIYIFVV